MWVVVGGCGWAVAMSALAHLFVAVSNGWDDVPVDEVGNEGNRLMLDCWNSTELSKHTNSRVHLREFSHAAKKQLHVPAGSLASRV